MTKNLFEQNRYFSSYKKKIIIIIAGFQRKTLYGTIRWCHWRFFFLIHLNLFFGESVIDHFLKARVTYSDACSSNSYHFIPVPFHPSHNIVCVLCICSYMLPYQKMNKPLILKTNHQHFYSLSRSTLMLRHLRKSSVKLHPFNTNSINLLNCTKSNLDYTKSVTIQSPIQICI